MTLCYVQLLHKHCTILPVKKSWRLIVWWYRLCWSSFGPKWCPRNWFQWIRNLTERFQLSRKILYVLIVYNSGTGWLQTNICRRPDVIVSFEFRRWLEETPTKSEYVRGLVYTKSSDHQHTQMHGYPLAGKSSPNLELQDQWWHYKQYVLWRTWASSSTQASILARANRNLGMMFKFTREFSDPYCLRSLHYSLVRSILESTASSLIWIKIRQNLWYLRWGVYRGTIQQICLPILLAVDF